MGTRFEHVYFMPWVGWKYGKQNPFKLRLMVLGESHYRWAMPHGQHETQRCVSLNIQDEDGRKFGPKVKGMVCGDEDISALDFWDSILFYNYIQEYVGNEARARPTSAMWSEAEPAFREVVEYYSPHVIIAIGKTLWDKMPRGGKEGPTINDGYEDHETWWYPTKKGKWALASYSDHTATIGYRSRDWQATIRVLLNTARDLKRRKLLHPR